MRLTDEELVNYLGNKLPALRGRVHSKMWKKLKGLDEFTEENYYLPLVDFLFLSHHLGNESLRALSMKFNMKDDRLKRLFEFYGLPILEQKEAVRRARRPRNSYLDLTPKEVEVMYLVSRGATNSMIAEELNLTPSAVYSRLSRIYKNLGVSRHPHTNPRVAAALKYQELFPNSPVSQETTTLTPAEYRILLFLSQAYTNEGIAEEMGITVDTVARRVSEVYEKLGINDYADKRVVAAGLFPGTSSQDRRFDRGVIAY